MNIEFKLAFQVVDSNLGIKKEELESQKRNHRFIVGRAIFVKLMKDYLDTPWTQLGRALGDRNHATIINSYNTADSMMLDAGFRMMYSDCAQDFVNGMVKNGFQSTFSLELAVLENIEYANTISERILVLKKYMETADKTEVV
jgi:hypothetical protein|tara:strand:+ start:55 stop:483 length:429 start_codon:yes stop_codon:yes gene_type:complete